MTVPLAAAWIGVPAGTPMSSPGCDEQSPLPRQREPNALVIGPFTGQMNPEADGWPLPLEPEAGAGERAAAARCAAWNLAESAALSACSAFDSATNSLSSTLIDESVSRFDVRATASCCCDEISSAATACC